MAFRDPLQERRAPLIWAGVAATIVAALIALFLLLADRRDHIGPGGYGGARNEFDELIEPVAGVLATPVRWLADASTEVKGYFFAVSENRRLRARVKELERWRDAAIALKNVNTRYEALLKLRTEPPIPSIAARVVSDARGPFSNARLADAGADAGVKAGDPVMSEHGLVGRVVGVSKDASRVLLLTDVESRVPVLIDRNNARSILTGDGGPSPRLEYLRGQDPVHEGDLILTSGDGGVYPRGLPVGVAAKDLRGVWRVRLYADREAIDYVRMLDFQDFGKLVDAEALAAKSPPPLDPTQQAQLVAALSAKTAPPTAATVPNGTAASGSATAPASTKPAAPPLSSAHPREGGDPGLLPATSAEPKPASPALSSAKPSLSPSQSRPSLPSPPPCAARWRPGR